jgi:hypothetical protein
MVVPSLIPPRPAAARRLLVFTLAAVSALALLAAVASPVSLTGCSLP